MTLKKQEQRKNVEAIRDTSEKEKARETRLYADLAAGNILSLQLVWVAHV